MLVVLAALVAAVWARPALAACLLIFLTPLTAGIDRGSALPVLRPQEALAVVLGGTLAARGVVRLRTGQLPRIRLGPVEWALVLMAVASSLLPLLRMAVRQEAIGQDDVLYALVLWKYLGLYVLIRASVSTDRHVRACLWLSVAASTVVAAWRSCSHSGCSACRTCWPPTTRRSGTPTRSPPGAVPRSACRPPPPTLR